MKNLKNFWLAKSEIIKWKTKPKLAFKKRNNNKILWYPDGKLNVADSSFKQILIDNLIVSAGSSISGIATFSDEVHIGDWIYHNNDFRLNSGDYNS